MDTRFPGRYIDEIEIHERAPAIRKILSDAQLPEPPLARAAARYVVGAALASLAALAYDYLSDFSIGFSRPEEQAFLGFLALFVALWGGLGLLAQGLARAANRRRSNELTALCLRHVHRTEPGP